MRISYEVADQTPSGSCFSEYRHSRTIDSPGRIRNEEQDDIRDCFGRDPFLFCGVSMVAGMMQFTLMFEVLSSAAIDSVRRRTALLEAL